MVGKGISHSRPASSSSSSSSSSSELDDEGAAAGSEVAAEAELAPLLATYPYCIPVGRRGGGGEAHEKTSSIALSADTAVGLRLNMTGAHASCSHKVYQNTIKF